MAGESRQAWYSLQVKLCDPCLSALCEIIRTWRYRPINLCMYLLHSAVLRGSVLAVLMFHCVLSVISRILLLVLSPEP